MAEYQFSKLVYILFLTSVTTELVASLQRGVLQRYREYQLDDRFCTAHSKKVDAIKMSNEKNGAIIVTTPWEFPTVLSWQSWCKYRIIAAKGENLFAVIQKMNLRRNDTHCIDYVMFTRKDHHGSRKFCGHLDRRMGTNKTALAHFNGEVISETRVPEDFSDFDVNGGEIETTLYVRYPPAPDETQFDLTIVYTSYKDCKNMKKNREEYVAEHAVTTNYSVCIGKEYVCDGFQNCVSQICQDEYNCAVVGNGTGTKVTIGAVTTILLCFIIFVMSIWICRKNKKLCWSSDCAGPSAHDNRLARAERETANSVNPSVAVAPMLEVPVVTPVSNKDLPPSYDSLFSDPPNPSAT